MHGVLGLPQVPAVVGHLNGDGGAELVPQPARKGRSDGCRPQVVSVDSFQQRQQAIQTLVKPLEEQHKIYQERLAQTHTTQTAALGEVTKQMELLSKQSLSLAQETQ